MSTLQSSISTAAALIRQGAVVAFPTETVYGLGASALNAEAVARIFEIKGRPRFDPLIVHIAGLDQLSTVAAEIPGNARELIQRFWPGPLSIVLPKQTAIPDIVTAGLPTVAVRCPDHEVALRLIESAGVPIAAPSANVFGGISPTTAEHVRTQFGDRLSCILDAGPCRIGIESSVISFVDERPALLRHGGVSLEQITELIGPVAIATSEDAQPASPGQLSRHYAPSTPLDLIEGELPDPGSERVGLLTFQAPRTERDFAAVEILSVQGCMREAAANLFAALRRLDALALDRIIASAVPEVGLGRAIMDRLRRAACR